MESRRLRPRTGRHAVSVMDFQRAILSISLGLILLLIWMAWVDYENEKNEALQSSAVTLPTEVPATPIDNAGTPSVSPAELAEEVPTAPVGASATPNVAGTTSATLQLETGQRVQVQTDLFQVEIDTFGGDLRDVRLRQYPIDIDVPEVPFRLIQDDSLDLLVAQSGLVGTEGGQRPNHKTQFDSPSMSYTLEDTRDSLDVPLNWTSPEGVEYQKIFTFYRNSYLVDVKFIVANRSPNLWRGYQYGQFLSTESVSESSGFFIFQALPSYRGVAVYTSQDKYEKIDYDDMLSENLEKNTNSGWVAMLQHYFVTAWLPIDGAPYQLYTKALGGGSSAKPRYQAGYITQTPLDVPAGETGFLNAQIYVGPKEQKRIRQPAEGLILTVDYGWLTPVSSPLFWILEKINDYIGNWGWSIILLTLLVKIVFYPLSAASYKSMAKMKKLQPRLKTLKERFGDDKQKMNQEMMQIYKKEKINPLGGCLPILIQIPVFIALYWVLLESVELRQAPFVLWLQDLSVKDPYFVLPILMGASMFAQQLLNPSPLDTMQKNIMMSLPIVFTIFFLWFPAGLVLYWLVNNLLSIAQQWYITRKLIPS